MTEILLKPRSAVARAELHAGLLQTAALFLLLLLPFSLLMGSDTRTVFGLSAWVKPMKFALSLGVHLATLALFWRWLPATLREGWRGLLLTALLLVPSLFEMTYIAAQAAAGQDSHFNLSTAYTRGMFALMGVFAVILTLATAAFGAAILKGRTTKESDRETTIRLSIGLGLMLSGLLGLVTGAVISVHGGHLVGGVDGQQAVVPLFGWSRQAGDLRISHFLGLHAAQALPLAGWLAARRMPARGRTMVWLSAVALTLLTLGTLGTALAGLPIL